jgi:hypothetical protein
VHHSHAELQKHLGRYALYLCEYNNPSLFYLSTFNSFDREIYDFKTELPPKFRLPEVT